MSLLREQINDLYRVEIRKLRDQCRAGQFPATDLAPRVVELRKRYMLLSIPTALLAYAPNLAAFAVLRILQGLYMASAFTLTLAYLGEQCSATDAAGNTGPDSAANSFTVDTTAPAAPVVLTPANSSTTSDNTPTYSGTAEPNSGRRPSNIGIRRA